MSRQVGGGNLTWAQDLGPWSQHQRGRRRGSSRGVRSGVRGGSPPSSAPAEMRLHLDLDVSAPQSHHSPARPRAWRPLQPALPRTVLPLVGLGGLPRQPSPGSPLQVAAACCRIPAGAVACSLHRSVSQTPHPPAQLPAARASEKEGNPRPHIIACGTCLNPSPPPAPPALCPFLWKQPDPQSLRVLPHCAPLCPASSSSPAT